MKVWTNVQGFSEYLELLHRKRDGLADAWQLLGSDAKERGNGIQGEMAGDARAAAEQQLVAFEGRGGF